MPLYILIFKFLERRKEDKRFCLVFKKPSIFREYR